MDVFLVYIAIINFIAFLLSFIDKRCAIGHRRRIPERTLFISAALGGSVGLYLSMLIFRHKTRHLSFMLGVPAIFAIQAVLAWFIATSVI